jgi:hypothetical protein
LPAIATDDEPGVDGLNAAVGVLDAGPGATLDMLHINQFRAPLRSLAVFV